MHATKVHRLRVVAEGADAPVTRPLPVLACLVIVGCSHMPPRLDGGLDGGPVQRCWAPAETVFATIGPTTLATAYRGDGGGCFSAASSYRLTSVRTREVVEPIEVDGDLRTPRQLAGIYYLETLVAETWVRLERLYFARPARSWLIDQACIRGEALPESFACNGRVHFADGGTGPVADEWLNGAGVVFALRDGGISAGASISQLSPFVSTGDVTSWSGDVDGLATLSSTFVLSLFDADGGRRDMPLQRDAGVGLVFRRASRTYFSRLTRSLTGELCEAETFADSGCLPGYVTAALGDEAWGPPAIVDGDWSVVAYVFDGGWVDDPQDRSFVAPSGWGPASTSLRAVQNGVVVQSPNQRRALAWHGVRDGRDDMVLFELPAPLVATGLRSSIAWVSWDGGTFVTR